MFVSQYIRRPNGVSLTTRICIRTFSRSARTLRHVNSITPTGETISTRNGRIVDRAAIDALLRRRMYYTPSFQIYGGSSGFFDLGPPGSTLQSNLIQSWKDNFVLQEDMLELDCPVVTPEDVLRTSGHVDKFTDWLCKDLESGEVFRADHLVRDNITKRLEEHELASDEKTSAPRQDAKKLNEDAVSEYRHILTTLGDLDGASLMRLIDTYRVRSPTTDGELSPPVSFNLMFQTSIGPGGGSRGYLRPETAQGQFTNFAKLLEYNQNKMPFASASVGKAYRNEISPRSGLIRVREFLLAEIEHYIDPASEKKHARFGEVVDVELNLLDQETQLKGSCHTICASMGSAVSKGLVNNETLAYYMARTQQFLIGIGIEPTKLRFRQHLPNEMAHYASECWDAEIQCSYGWIECVGCADRAAYDLTQHAKKTGAALTVLEPRREPIRIEEWQIGIDMRLFGPKFKTDARAIKRVLLSLTQQEREKLNHQMQEKGKVTIHVPSLDQEKVEISQKLLRVEKRPRMSHTREYTPNVIEPSFGIGRILYCLMEHSYWEREAAEERAVLSFPPWIAPIKTVLLPLSNHQEFSKLLRKLQDRLRMLGISCRVDDSSASIGKRYARSDELGIPFGITVDFQSLKDNTFTLRDRDTTKQVRADEETLCTSLKELINGTKAWHNILQELPSFQSQE